MLVEIIVLLFFLVASLYLAYQFRSCGHQIGCLLYTSDAADELLCVDLGGRRIINKKTSNQTH